MLELNGNKINSILAPMTEISDYPCRAISKEYGADLTFTQMVSAKGVIENSFETLKQFVFNKKEKPIGIQLLSKDAGFLSEAVKELQKYNPDVIDLNSGCPVKDVCGKGMGAKLMDDPIHLGKLTKSMVQSAGGMPISVKVRLGMTKVNVMDVAKAAEENGASFITVHARTRNDFYTGPVRLDLVREVKKQLKIPVVVNGSCFSLEDYMKIKNETDCDAVMVARGALGNPFLFSQIKQYEENKPILNVGIEEIKRVALSHFNLILQNYGEDFGVKYARKFFVWYFMKTPLIEQFIDNIYKIDNKDKVYIYIDEYSEAVSKYNGTFDNTINIDKFKEKVLFWFNNKC